MATGNDVTPAIQALSSALAVAIDQYVGGANNQSSSASFSSSQTAAAQPSTSGSAALVGTLPNWAYELLFTILAYD